MKPLTTREDLLESVGNRCLNAMVPCGRASELGETLTYFGLACSIGLLWDAVWRFLRRRLDDGVVAAPCGAGNIISPHHE